MEQYTEFRADPNVVFPLGVPRYMSCGFCPGHTCTYVELRGTCFSSNSFIAMFMIHLFSTRKNKRCWERTVDTTFIICIFTHMCLNMRQKVDKSWKAKND